MRLLPWPSPDGKPCFLSTDDAGGRLSRLADDMEAVQLATGTDVLGLARGVLGDPHSPYAEVRFAGIRLAECLSDALRVAESRGLRLPQSSTYADDDAYAEDEDGDGGGVGVGGEDGDDDGPPSGVPTTNPGSGLWSSPPRVEGASPS